MGSSIFDPKKGRKHIGFPGPTQKDPPGFDVVTSCYIHVQEIQATHVSCFGGWFGILETPNVAVIWGQNSWSWALDGISSVFARPGSGKMRGLGRALGLFCHGSFRDRILLKMWVRFVLQPAITFCWVYEGPCMAKLVHKNGFWSHQNVPKSLKDG